MIILKEDLSERPPKNIDFLLKTRTYIKWSRDENRQAKPGNEYAISVSGEKVKFPKHWKTAWVFPVLRIRLFSIPDPNFFHPVSRIRIKEFKYFNQ